MSKKNLNLKSLIKRQDGGASSDPETMSLAQQAKQLLESGASPKSVANELFFQGYSEMEIKDVFASLGLSLDELDDLFETEEEIEEEVEETTEDVESPEEDYDEDSDLETGIFGNYLAEAQYGNMGAFPTTINQWLEIEDDSGYRKDPRANYLPMDIGARGDLVGAGFALAEGLSNMFSGKVNPSTGLKEGFFRDAPAKKARAKEVIPSYYNYKVTTAAGDPNTYVGDINDLYAAATGKGGLRTQEQYESDLAKYSRTNFNPETGKYEAILTSRQIDPNSKVYGQAQKKALEEFLGKSTSVEDFRKRFDPATRDMLLGTVNEGQGYLGISPSGEASTYMDAASNPYYYETMMGLNTLQSNTPSRVNVSAAPQMKRPFRYGGNIPMAQQGLEKPLSYEDWLQQNNRGLMGEEGRDMQEYQDYISFFDVGQTTPPAIVTTPTTQTTAPNVEITNKTLGTLNRFFDSRPVQGFGQISDFLVKGAGYMNELAQNRKAREAEQRLYEMTQADKMFGYYEDPLNKQGTWDVNTGLAEQDNRTTYMRQFGGEDGSDMMYDEINLSEEIELDPDTIAQLIAAGADIEIL